jgi:hypothetical protein
LLPLAEVEEFREREVISREMEETVEKWDPTGEDERPC